MQWLPLSFLLYWVKEHDKVLRVSAQLFCPRYAGCWNMADALKGFCFFILPFCFAAWRQNAKTYQAQWYCRRSKVLFWVFKRVECRVWWSCWTCWLQRLQIVQNLHSNTFSSDDTKYTFKLFKVALINLMVVPRLTFLVGWNQRLVC